MSQRSQAQQHAAGVGFYTDVELVYPASKDEARERFSGKGGKRSGWFNSGGGGGKRGCSEEDDEGDSGTAVQHERKLYLKLGNGHREPSSAFAVDDLWFVAGSADALCTSPLVLRSVWHGPAQSGMLEVKVLQPGATAPRHGLKVVALRGPNASDHLQQLDMLAALQLPRPHVAASPPLLPCLLDPTTAPPATRLGISYPRGGSPDLAALLKTSFERFRLNPEQAVVLRRVAQWLGYAEPPGATGAGGGDGDGSGCSVSAPALLVHGVFGAGKSHLLVAILWFLQRALRRANRAGRPVKVLLAALTNVAVDNVLEGLLAQNNDEQEPDIVRVGSVRRISAAVLPHSTHGKLAKDEEASTRRELQRDLDQARDASERRTLQQAIQFIDSGRMAARAKAMHKFTVVGATCAATGLACVASSAPPRPTPSHACRW